MTRCILITRPEPEARIMAEHCARLGFDSIISPLTHIEPIASAHLPSYDSIILTSPHGLHTGIIPMLSPASIFYVVGGRAADKAVSCGFTVASVFSSVRDLEHTLLHNTQATQRFLYLSGEHITSTLPIQNATRVITYRAIAASTLNDVAIDALRSANPPVVSFASKRNVAIFSSLTQGMLSLANLEALCLSPAIALAATKEGFSMCFSAAASDMEALLIAYKGADCRIEKTMLKAVYD